MGGVIGECKGHHSSLSDAIEVEVIGFACDELGMPMNIGDAGLLPIGSLSTLPCRSCVVAGTCMNTGKTVAATEIIKQAANAGLKVAGAKLSGIACLRDTLNMEDHGAFATASFLDCGLPSTVGAMISPRSPSAFSIISTASEPDLIVAELGDGIIGGYGVDSVLRGSFDQ